MAKKVLALGLLLIMLFSLMGCENKLEQGTYTTDDGMSSVVLYDDNQFAFDRHVALSYLPTGSYSIERGKLILHATDDEEYIFEIKNGKLIFVSGELAELFVEAGTVFKLSD